MSASAIVFTPTKKEITHPRSLDSSGMDCLDFFIQRIQHNYSDVAKSLYALGGVMSSFTSRIVSDNSLYRCTYFIAPNEKTDVQKSLIQRVLSFSSLNPGWNNNENAKPINIKALNTAETIINKLSDEELRGWRIFPEELGSILFEYSNADIQAAMSMGEDGFSTMVYGDSFYESGNYKSIDLKTMVSFIKEVNQKR